VPKIAPRSPRQSGTQLSGPASLATPDARSLARCRFCGATPVTSIAMTLTDGSHVHFGSCHRCESRWWQQDGEQMSFDHVIAKTRKIA